MNDGIAKVYYKNVDEQVQRRRPTLRCVLDLRIPAPFTTYNKTEAVDEERVFMNMGAQFSRKMAENLWQGVFPRYDMFVERYDVYYFNHYWYIVEGRTHG